VRLTLAGATVVRERVLGQLPARCTHLEVVDDAVYATAAGSSGGLYRLPRLGGAAVQLIAEPNAAALMAWAPTSTALIVAWSGGANGPGFGFFDLQTNAWTLGPWNEPSLGTRTVTGIGDLPTALVREVVSFADGGFELVVYGGPAPTPVAAVPAIPPGGGAATKPVSPGGFTMRGLGSAQFPWLYDLEVWGMMPNVTMRAGPLPGDPVDLALVPREGANMLLFGRSCGTPPPHLNSRAWPVLGNLQFAINLSGGAPLQATAFALGLSDNLSGLVPLPYVLPSGCELRVAPDAVLFQFTNGNGDATQVVPIPNQPALIGLLVFGQWLQYAALPFAASEAVAMQVGL
jgi:hypothetical protein